MKSKEPIKTEIKVLHVDDEPHFLELSKIFLERVSEGNFSVTTLDDPTKVLSYLEEAQYDIILSDFQMPKLDGLELLKLVREKLTIPFVIFTGRGREEIAIQALNLGANHYIRKGGEDPQSLYKELAHTLEQLVAHRRTEEALFKSHERLQATLFEWWEAEENYRFIVETMNDGLVIYSEQGQISFVNSSLVNMLGFTKEEILVSEITDYCDSRNQAIYKAEGSKQRNFQTESYELELQHKNKKTLTVIVSPQLILTANGKIRGSFDVIKDITRRKAIEEELRLQWENLSDFTRFLSHDINNSFSVLEGYLDLFRKSENVNPLYVQRSLEQITAMRKLLRTSLKYATVGFSFDEIEELDLNQIIEEINDNFLPKDVEFHGGGLPNIKGERGKVFHVFRNIIENAIVHGKASKIEIKSQESGDSCQIIIVNNGKEIPEKEISKIFKPGFTTKPGNTGLGLAIVNKIVNDSGWTINASSSPHETQFVLGIPKSLLGESN